MTFWDLIAHAAAHHPDRMVVSDDHGRSLTSAQLASEAERAAAGLGLSPGEIVSWQVPTTLEAVVLMAAFARVGAVQNPIIPILRHREVALITAQVGTQRYVAAERWGGFEFAAMGRELGLDVIGLDLDDAPGTAIRLPAGDPSTLPTPPTSDDEVRWVYYSSGTTAAPKGVKHSDPSVMASANAMNDQLGIGEGDRYPIAFPLTHIGGISMITAALRGGAQLVLFDRFDPATTGERMAAHRPTLLGSAQPFFRVYLDAQYRHGSEPLFPDLRVCTAGGAPTPPEIVTELVETFGIVGVLQSWGLTEFPIATSTTVDDSPEVLLHSVGKPAAGVQVRVVDGELRVKGPQLFHGYVDSSLDVDAFDDDGWFRTGDLGRIDDAGNVYITGRLKDVIIRNAENISAAEVESVLLRHPSVVDCAVIGLPDPRTGEKVVAAIALVEGAEPLTLDEVAAHCAAEGLVRQKTPVEVRVLPSIPRNPMGKILKQDLRAGWPT